MANIKSSERDIKKSRARHERNVAIRSTVKTYIKKCREVAASGDEAQKAEAFKSAQSAIDKAVTKGVIKPNTGSRYKSRLAALL